MMMLAPLVMALVGFILIWLALDWHIVWMGIEGGILFGTGVTFGLCVH